MYYLDEINGVECATYEEAEESVMTAFDDDEIIDRAMLGRTHDVLNELRRFRFSPLLGTVRNSQEWILKQLFI